VLNVSQIGEVFPENLAELLMTLPGRTASDGKDALHVRIQQAFAQNALPNHASGAEQNDLHGILYLGAS
jgi:hypothetical protein